MNAAEPGSGSAVPPLRLHESLARMMAAHDSGRLRLVHPTAARDLWYEGGRIVSVTSSRGDEKLGSWLAGRRLVPAEVVGEVLATLAGGERLGAALVRRGALAPEVLRRELQALSLALLARMTLQGGEAQADGGAGVAPDARTLDAPPRPLFVAAMRASEEIEAAADGLGQETGWAAADVVPEPETGVDLTENERYVLSLLKRPRTLDGLRRGALIDFVEAVRAVAVLAVAGFVTPCECRATPPPPRPLAEALATAPAADGESDGSGDGGGPAAGAPGAAAPKRDVRAMLDALDQAEASAAPMCDIEGHVATLAQRRRVVTMLESVDELLAAGGDRRAVKQLLNRALGIFPALAGMLKLTEIELADPNLRQLALDRLQRILAKNPRCTQAWLLLARYWEARGSIDKVRGCAAKILAYDPDNDDARQLAGGPSA
jgi:tetratricopeptide (TPR) repeat protein